VVSPDADNALQVTANGWKVDAGDIGVQTVNGFLPDGTTKDVSALTILTQAEYDGLASRPAKMIYVTSDTGNFYVGNTWFTLNNITIEGASDYTTLDNKPQINGNLVAGGNQTADSLGLVDKASTQTLTGAKTFPQYGALVSTVGATMDFNPDTSQPANPTALASRYEVWFASTLKTQMKRSNNTSNSKVAYINDSASNTIISAGAVQVNLGGTVVTGFNTSTGTTNTLYGFNIITGISSGTSGGASVFNIYNGKVTTYNINKVSGTVTTTMLSQVDTADLVDIDLAQTLTNKTLGTGTVITNGTLTADQVLMSGDPTVDLGIATKQYVDNHVPDLPTGIVTETATQTLTNKTLSTGTQITAGTITKDAVLLTGAPTVTNGIANKGYVDSAISPVSTTANNALDTANSAATAASSASTAASTAASNAATALSTAQTASTTLCRKATFSVSIATGDWSGTAPYTVSKSINNPTGVTWDYMIASIDGAAIYDGDSALANQAAYVDGLKVTQASSSTLTFQAKCFSYKPTATVPISVLCFKTGV